MTVFHGTRHNDTLDESSDTSSDTFALYKGGDDTAIGGSGDDTFNLGASLNAADRLDGGGGHDTVLLHGDYSAGVIFDADTIKNIEVLHLGEGFDYNLTLNDGNVASGETLTVNARALGAGHHLTFDGSAELDGSFTIYDSAGNDTITGGAQADKFNLSTGGNDTVHGGGGNDVFNLGTALTAADSINGGSGDDTIHFDGDLHTDIDVIATATTMTSIETIDFGTGSYDLTTADAMVDAGTTMHVNVRGSSTILTFNTVAETDGFFAIDSNATENFITFGSAAVLAGSTFTGTGTDNALLLNGDFSAGVTLNAAQLADFQTLNVLAGHDYNLTTTADAVNANGFEVFADALGAGNSLTFDGSAQTTASFTIFDGAGDDNITTGGGRDDIFVTGGTDIVHAGGGDDVISTGLTFNVSDQFDGGTGYDTVSISSGGTFVFNATTIQNIEELDLSVGSYTITTNDANVASGAVLKVDASQLTAVQVLTFDGTAETNGFFAITGGAGADVVKFGSNFSASDTFDGGAGNDTLELGSTGSPITFTADTMKNIETLKIDGSVNLILDDGNVAAGAMLTVDASAASSTLAVNGSAETDGTFDFIAGTGGDLFSGGAGNDFFDMSNSAGTSTEKGNGGDDTFLFAANFDRLRDSIDGGTDSDTLEFNGAYTSLALSDAHVTSIETLRFLGNHSYTGVALTGDIADGSTLTIDASAASNLSIDLTAATSAAYAITGSAGDDTIKFANNFSASDTVNGGGGNDTLELGSTGSPITFTANTMQNIETLKIDGSVNLILDDGNVAAGAMLTVDASAASSTLAVNGSAETDGTFDFIAGTGGDLFSGGAGNDFFDMSNTGGTSTEKGNGGDDTFLFAANFDRLRDKIDGGTGSDTLTFNGAYTSLALSDTSVTSIETLKFLGGHSYTGVTITGDIADGSTLTIDASAASNLSIDLSAATSAAFAIVGSAGNDTIIGSSQADTITGGLGADTLTGGAGGDIFSYASLSESNTVNGYDTITDLTTSDSIHIAGGVPTFFAAGNEDTYQGSLDNDLIDFFSHLGAGKYGVVTLTDNTDPLKGHVFLVIDGDGQMGYAAGADYVIDITNFSGDPSLIHFT